MAWVKQHHLLLWTRLGVFNFFSKYGCASNP